MGVVFRVRVRAHVYVIIVRLKNGFSGLDNFPGFTVEKYVTT